LLIANCDEFIFYDDLVRESQRAVGRRDPKAVQTMPRLSPEEYAARKAEAIELAVTTFDALVVERGESGKVWASMLKEAMKRRKPDFHEGHFGFRSFGNLLEEAQVRGLLEVGRDEKSGAYVSRSAGLSARHEPEQVVPAAVAAPVPDAAEANEVPAPVVSAEVAEAAPAPTRRRGRGRGKGSVKESVKDGLKEAVSEAAKEEVAPVIVAVDAVPQTASVEEPVAAVLDVAAEEGPAPPKPAASRGRRPRKPKAAKPSVPEGA